MRIRVNNITYHVEMEGQGEPLVLLHGFTGSSANWSEHINAFVQDFCVVTIDLLGHGQTGAPTNPERFGIEHAARDVIAIFAHLALAKVHLLGYSMGGRLALYMTIHHPERIQTLLLESGSPGIENPDERRARVEQDEKLARMIETGGLEKFVAYWESIPLFSTQSPEMRVHLRKQRLRNNPTGLANSLRGMGTGVQPSLWGGLKTLNLPTLLITGELDTKFATIAHQMSELLSQHHLSSIEGAGHTTHLEQPTKFQKVVSHFLSSVES